MRVRLLCILMLCILVGRIGHAQDCPMWGDREAALRFLLANKAHATDADPVCVNRAFSTLSRDKSSAGALVGLLDFERSTKRDDFKSTSAQYPAIGALHRIGQPAVAHLIKAIKESESDVVRTNAAHALSDIFAPCVDGLIAKLEAESAKAGTTNDQQAKLRTAEQYIRSIYPQPCKSSAT
jgi:hypothetical protein